jgi:hypothetical protein
MAKDPVLKLAKQATKDTEKLLPLLEATVEELAPETKDKLENAPKFDADFLKSEAERFHTTTEKVEAIAEVVSTEGPVFVEERTWEVDADIKEHFKELYEKEISRRRVCDQMIQVEEERQRKQSDGQPTGRREMISVWKRCGAVYESFQQALVHQSLHLMFDAKDERTKRAMWNDIRELVYPTREKGIRAALTPQERRRMMDDRLKDRLLRG